MSKPSKGFLLAEVGKSKVKEMTTELKNSITAIQERLTEAEGHLSTVEDTTTQLVDASKQNNTCLENLWNQVEDLKSRSWCDNVRLDRFKGRGGNGQSD